MFRIQSRKRFRKVDLKSLIDLLTLVGIAAKVIYKVIISRKISATTCFGFLLTGWYTNV